jgi:diacylglycerol kinase family enzyme
MKKSMFKQEEISLVVNQDSGKVPSKMRALSKLSKEYNIKLKMCDGPDLDFTIREQLKNKKLKRLIVGGGDGTVSLAASLARRLRPKIEIAVLPLGTANYYAKSLGLDRNLELAFETAFNGEVEKRYLCTANKRDFLIGVNIGATSHMFNEVTDEDKKRFGRFAYVKGILEIFTKFSSPDIIVKTNGKKYKFVSTELVVLNHHIHETINITPKVKGTEPYFEIITYGLGNSKLSPVFAVFMFAITLGRNQKYLKRIQTTKATIKSNTHQPVAIDGDIKTELPLKISLVKNPISFVKTKV